MFSNELSKKIVETGEQLFDSPHSFIISIFNGIADTYNDVDREEFMNRLNKVCEKFKITFDNLYKR